MAATEQDWHRDKVAFVAGSHDPSSQDIGPLAREFALLTQTLLHADTVAGALQEVVVVALEVVPGADVVSVTLCAPDGTYHTPVETDPVAVELDQLQYDNQEGPCVEASKTPGPAYFSSPDLATEPAWPSFGPAAAKHGFRSVLSTALLYDAHQPRPCAALNCYSREANAFDAHDRDIALLLATHASLALANTQALTRADLQEQHLRKALDSRDTIGMAKGILMQRRGISAEDAFDLLRRTSQDLNIRLTKIAETIVARRAELDDRAATE
ncbi:GAF and ANTAR domain-containing protein [Labedaea rhizosphaerae]|uniref:GAF domain-containing protein n=1 Tax=Labedaea rhizosphaerae TaxID=598644 RepID=A0A4R6SAL1_LABRH|nr:GAF and ANTAR domain-containing protein [Labedaea rhizosphaerae]TDP96467.1 GAF domain-containing protein [Labedaea rhizosphaerae]